ncbi:dTDP-4-dehydrorhamnose reductase [Glaciibacter superstes]|uniref:dTDP-4-dehydrorhamnose reductase n=1 Tax=Glaciibacter superstes TaxID=501023 RepID=UPI0004049500|nr:dTDP-4-dehydrorhamnose reductase [Glaciibacter superstes]
MKYLITGASGMLGHDLQAVLADRSATASSVTSNSVTALARADLDITNAKAVQDAVAGHDVVINAAAYTKVDDAESHEDEAYAVNAIGAQNLAAAASGAGAKLVQVSTDYVFNGSATTPYAEGEPYDPISAYGRTKAEGEKLAIAAHPSGTFVVRAAWLYGEHGPNFAKTMLKLAASKDTWGVVDDQLGQPTWTHDLAEQLVRLVDSDAPAGIYHGTNSGQATWLEFARAVLVTQGLDPERITPTDSSAFVRPAPRPSYSVLGHDAWAAAGLTPMRDWREALDAANAQGIFVS